jgi:hypothetical protein
MYRPRKNGASTSERGLRGSLIVPICQSAPQGSSRQNLWLNETDPGNTASPPLSPALSRGANLSKLRRWSVVAGKALKSLLTIQTSLSKFVLPLGTGAGDSPSERRSLQEGSHTLDDLKECLNSLRQKASTVSTTVQTPPFHPRGHLLW